MEFLHTETKKNLYAHNSAAFVDKNSNVETTVTNPHRQWIIRNVLVICMRIRHLSAPHIASIQSRIISIAIVHKRYMPYRMTFPLEAIDNAFNLFLISQIASNIFNSILICCWKKNPFLLEMHALWLTCTLRLKSNFIRFDGKKPFLSSFFFWCVLWKTTIVTRWQLICKQRKFVANFNLIVVMCY